MTAVWTANERQRRPCAAATAAAQARSRVARLRPDCAGDRQRSEWTNPRRRSPETSANSSQRTCISFNNLLLSRLYRFYGKQLRNYDHEGFHLSQLNLVAQGSDVSHQALVQGSRAHWVDVQKPNNKT